MTSTPVPVYNWPPMYWGRPAMMPAKIMTEMPLPMPFSLISSPIQTRNIVPAVIVISSVRAWAGRLGPVS